MAQKQDPVRSLVDVEGHILYTGVSLSGKTTLARLHSRKLCQADYDVIVYDPVQTETAGGDWGKEAVIFTDPVKFIEALEKAQATEGRPIFAFVDEAADLFSHTDGYNNLLPRKIRHQGVYLRIIAQRPKLISPSVRSQCWYAFMFRLTRDDARELTADFGHGPEVYNMALDRGDFIVLESGSTEIQQANVFDLVGGRKP